jgi:hypothetical protein
MSALLIYIGGHRKFNVEKTVSAIKSIPGVSNFQFGENPEPIFEFEYDYQGRNAIIYMERNAETIVSDGLGDESIQFILELQRRMDVNLRAFDGEYSFDLPIKPYSTVSEFKHAADM